MPGSARNTGLVRVLRLIALLREWRSIEQLASELGVCTRTVRRDLEAIAEAGLPLKADGSSRRIDLDVGAVYAAACHGEGFA